HPRKDRLTGADLRSGSEQRPERLCFGVEPGQSGFGLVRRLQRGLLYGTAPSCFLLARYYRSATRLDPLFRRGEDVGGGSGRLNWRHSRSQAITLALSLRAARLQTRAALDELDVAPLQGGTARLVRGSGLGHALQRRFGLGEASGRLVRAICSHLARRPDRRVGIGDRQALF